ncbi:bifunctional adenosylcobinamide kinase/adenosylcobinamide-phosphate guanylyltransferase [Alicyclobacillus dauci]|uniref:Adenosylcobinamide kinase n=1 Tax=Alicyclobacillus dauci TaxID=1475485 RepID=A0ABY6Z7P3_9BACL|nr:bifunctional adenosylcobinamide kinase/adenosylcobinamide-phosphate guanylyltransferase [Alicyclobacillus dauci]WAH38713.1 bifunctional adenosylcobinamide kinase/adenosylcobinamide-phosphate guanylyltransferase [Alicyclobacillus dauci]
MTVYFVTGGARSGKSHFAERLAASKGTAQRICFVATGVAMDDEMAARIERHRTTRDSRWATVETPHDVAGVVRQGLYDVYLIDCLSLLLNNWMYDLHCTEEMYRERVSELINVLDASSAECIVVSNEIGLGLIPADAESRRYRDWLGWFNQAMARIAERVYFVASGIAVDLKAIPGAVRVDEL